MELGGADEMWFIDNEQLLRKLHYREGMEWEIMRAKHGLSRLGLSSALDETHVRYWIACGSHSGQLATMLGPSPDHRHSTEALTAALQNLGMIVS
jgi:hypothetical protein